MQSKSTKWKDMIFKLFPKGNIPLIKVLEDERLAWKERWNKKKETK